MKIINANDKMKKFDTAGVMAYNLSQWAPSLHPERNK